MSTTPHHSTPSAATAAEMHDLSVRLWNELWAEANQSLDFPRRDLLEQTQQMLADIAWPVDGPVVPATHKPATPPSTPMKHRMTNAEQSACDHAESLYGRCTACGMTWQQQSAAEQTDSPDAASKASRMFTTVEAINVLRDDDHPGRFLISVNTGATDEFITDDLDEHVALGIAHALDVVYAAGVYDDEGRLQ